jgi:hypothetical protein
MRPAETFAIAVVVLSMACGDKSQRGDVPAGTILHAVDDHGQPLELRIDSITDDSEDPDGELQLYELSANVDGKWTSYCKPDAFGVAKAVVLAGAWDERGDYHASKQLTVACTAGALGKCVRWGYKPWKTLDGASLADFHQACVRMTRADYCGNGKPHTVDGTWIDLYDRLGIQRSDPEGLATEFEAGWSASGATYINVPRWDTAEAIVAECPDKLAGRVAVNGTSLSRADILARFPETVLFNDHAAFAGDKQHRPGGFSRPQR